MCKKVLQAKKLNGKGKWRKRDRKTDNNFNENMKILGKNSAMATRAKFGESGESAQNRLANVGKSGESGTFLKKAILASTRIRQKWRISGKYSNSINSLSSGHCLV